MYYFIYLCFNTKSPYWHLVQQSKPQILVALMDQKYRGEYLRTVRGTNQRYILQEKIRRIQAGSPSKSVNEIYSNVTFLSSGEKDSFVHGSIINKVFTGKITTARGTSYWVEHADKYFDEPEFHSIIYAEHDVNNDPQR